MERGSRIRERQPTMLLIIQDPIFEAHRVPRGHPERPARLQAISALLGRRSWPAGEVAFELPSRATEEELARVHDPAYIARLRDFCQAGGGALDDDTYCVSESWEAALRAAGAAQQGVRAVLERRARCALALVRPPGHHAGRDYAMGFCLFNNVALGAAQALAFPGVERILIVDWDLHHGNGTQEIFYRDPRVFYFSMHRHPFWPGTGAVEEEGQAAGRGYSRNLPLEEDASREEIKARFRKGLQEIRSTFSPQLLLLSAGFDMHRADPLGGLALEAEDFGELTRELVRVFPLERHGGLVACLEGGYDLEGLARSVLAHVEALHEISRCKGGPG